MQLAQGINLRYLVPDFSALSKVPLSTTSIALHPVEFLNVLNGYNLWTEKTTELTKFSAMTNLHFRGQSWRLSLLQGDYILILLPEMKFTIFKTKYNLFPHSKAGDEK